MNFTILGVDDLKNDAFGRSNGEQKTAEVLLALHIPLPQLRQVICHDLNTSSSYVWRNNNTYSKQII